MGLYSFYPQTATGTALMFEIGELPCDAAARTQALEILRDHHSAVEVQVWRDDHMVFVVRPREPRSWAEIQREPASPAQ